MTDFNKQAFEERWAGLLAICRERHKGIEEDFACYKKKLGTKAEQKEVDEIKETLKTKADQKEVDAVKKDLNNKLDDKADKGSLKFMQWLQVMTFLAILGQLLYVIFR